MSSSSGSSAPSPHSTQSSTSTPRIPEPVVRDGAVYAGSASHHVYAIDAATGRERWRFAAGDRIIAPPTVVDGAVYVRSGGDDRGLYALDTVAGTLRWRSPAGGGAHGPLVVGDVVVVGVERALAALDAATGQERWRYSVKRTATVRSQASVDGVLYVSLFDDDVAAEEEGEILAIDLAAGRPGG